MYAVFESGGKQHKVIVGEILKLEKLESAVGDKIEFDKVFMIADDKSVQLGEPLLTGAKVTAEVLEQARHKKVKIIKFHRRKHHMKKQGHRQYYTAVKITGIKAKAAAKPKAAEKADA